jgi:3-hydroxyisobutyrate dehydrogenase-like beta-hydroxyacid dehydrogenase
MAADETLRVGFAGVGLMGLPMIRRLMATGLEVHAFDVDPARTEAAAAAGARVVPGGAVTAAQCEVVVLCVTGTSAVEAVVLGEGGVAERAGERTVVVDHSTADAGATREMATRLHERCGASWVDAPVSGGPSAAEAGDLAIMAGGELEVVERVRPIVERLGRLTRMGPVGAGQVTKMVNQVLVLTNFCVLAEALKLAEDGGIDAARLPECLAGGNADSVLLQRMLPRMQARDFEPPSGYARQVLKDLDMIHDLAKATGTPTPMSDMARMLYRLHVSHGNAHLDATSVVKVLDGPGAGP